MRANGNFSDASLELLHSVNDLGVNRVMSPSDAFDLDSPLVVSEVFFGGSRADLCYGLVSFTFF